MNFLNEKEISILKLIANGKRNNEIATELKVSEDNIKHEIQKLSKKMEVKNRIQLAVTAIRENII